MLDRLLALEFTGIKLGLENISRLCDSLGHPERTFKSIHIAGTNGKGSVTAMAHAALVAAGYRCARYTSPHLSELRERFVIGNDAVTATDLAEVADLVLDHGEELVRAGKLVAKPTFFEAATAIAFELFRRAEVEIAVIEVGLGGRFDATNVVPAVVGAITSIGFDHQQYLGDTLAAIAFEKAGIIKPGMPIVTGPLPQEAGLVIARIAAERRAHLIPARSGTSLTTTFEDGIARLALTTPAGSYGPLVLGLRGEHQVENAIVAVRLLEALSAAGVPVAASAIASGLTEARWPARLELITWPDGSRRLLVDAAHNPDGALTLARYLSRWHREPLPLVIGLMRDKDAVGILQHLLPVSSTIVATTVPTRRALPADELADQVRALDPTRRILVMTDPAAAIDCALAEGTTACVAGSIFLAGAVRDALKERAILR